MKKFLKILASLLLVIIIALAAIPYFYKDEIVDFIKKDINNLVNATVDFNDVEVSLFKDFPNFHLQLNQFTVEGKDLFQDIQLMNIEKIELSLNIKSVLFGDQIQINKFSATRGEIDIQVLADGNANYDIMKRDTLSKTEEPASFDIQLKEYQINNINLNYIDQSIGFETQIKNLNHRGKGAFNADLYQLSTHSTIDSLSLIYDEVTYLDTVVADIDTDLDISGEFTTYTLKNTGIVINDLPISAAGSITLNEDAILIDFKYNTADTSLEKLLSLVPKVYMPDLKGVNSTGIVNLKGTVKGKSTDLILPGFTVDINIKNATLHYPDLPEKVKNINLTTAIRFKEGSNLDNMVVDLSKIQFNIADNTARGNLKITHPISDPLINTKFKAIIDFNTINKAIKFEVIEKLKGILDTDFSINGRLSAIENQDYDNFKAKGFLKLDNFEYKSDSLEYEIKIPNARIDVKPEALHIKNFDTKIGASDFNIKGSISNYIAYALGKDEELKANLTSHSNYINMNDFMDSSEISDTTQSELVKIPKNLDITLIASAVTVHYTDMDMQDVKANLKLKEEQAMLSAIFMKSMGGNIKMNGLYDTSGDIAKTDVSFSMDKMPIKESATAFSTFQAYAPILQSITGQFFSNMDFSVDLDNQMNPILSTVNAKGNFKTNEIYPEGVTVLKKIGSIIKINELTNAKIDKLNASFSIKDGTISVLPVAFKLNNMQASFQGSFNLDKNLDFDLFIDVPREKLGSDINQVMESFVGGLDFLKLNTDLGEFIKMKFEISGDANNPKIKPILLGGTGETIVETVTNVVVDKIDEVKNEALLKAEAEADKLMAIAIEQKEKLVFEAQKSGQEVRNQAVIASGEIIKEAGENPLKLMAAKITTDTLKKEADKQAIKLVNIAEQKGDNLLKKAGDQAAQLLVKASQTTLDSIQ